jgi:hypothetical protein
MVPINNACERTSLYRSDHRAPWTGHRVATHHPTAELSPGNRACKHTKISEVLCFGAQPSFSFLLPHFWKLKFLAKLRFFSEEPVVQHIYSYLPYKDQGSEDNISQQNFMTVGNFFQCLHLQNCRIPYTSSIQRVMSAYPIPF